MSKRKVLVPLDGSEFSRQIVRVVQDYFDRARDVNMVLFGVVQPPAASLENPFGPRHDAWAATSDVRFV